MPQSESKPVISEFETLHRLDSNGVTPSKATSATGDDLEANEGALRGVVAIDIPREVVARFSGTLLLNELPQRQPEIVFDRGRQFLDDDDE
jgi:hypothetical protein